MFSSLFFPDTSRLPKALVLFLHMSTVPEATGRKMVPKTEIYDIYDMYVVWCKPGWVKNS